ncbi:hypothetical protein ACWEQP_31135 [Streptomyces sp. NPDC004044]
MSANEDMPTWIIAVLVFTVQGGAGTVAVDLVPECLDPSGNGIPQVTLAACRQMPFPRPVAALRRPGVHLVLQWAQHGPCGLPGVLRRLIFRGPGGNWVQRGGWAAALRGRSVQPVVMPASLSVVVACVS